MSPRSERRGGERLPLKLPLQVKWVDAQGHLNQEDTHTEVVNGAGCRIHLKHAVELGLEIEILNLDNRETAQGRVVWADVHSPARGQRVGVEFLTSRAAFWGTPYNH